MVGSDQLKDKINSVFKTIGIDVNHFSDSVDRFYKKCKLLDEKGRYTQLLSSIFDVNDINNFKALIFETSFAYDVESKGGSLDYEVSQNPPGLTTIDFFYHALSNTKVYFELRLISVFDKKLNSSTRPSGLAHHL